MARAVAATPTRPTTGGNEYARPRVIGTADAGPYTGPRELARFLVGRATGAGGETASSASGGLPVGSASQVPRAVPLIGGA